MKNKKVLFASLLAMVMISCDGNLPAVSDGSIDSNQVSESVEFPSEESSSEEISVEVSSSKEISEDVISSEESIFSEEINSSEEILLSENVVSSEDVVSSDEILSSDEIISSDDVISKEEISSEEVVSSEEIISSEEVISSEEIVSSEEVISSEEISSDDVVSSEEISSEEISSEEISSDEIISSEEISSETHIHKYVAGYNDEYHYEICSCEDIINEELHSYVDVEVDGYLVPTCLCGHTLEGKEIIDNIVSLYFSAPNDSYWGDKTYCYLWNNTTMVNNSWPGQEMTYVGSNDYGQRVYTIEVDLDQYDMIIFNNGNGWQSQDTSLSGAADNTGYYLGDNNVLGTYTFESSQIK